MRSEHKHRKSDFRDYLCTMSNRSKALVGVQEKATAVPVHGMLQRKCACGQHTSGSGQCDECKKKEMTLQRQAKTSGRADTIPPIVHEVLASPGRPLNSAMRWFMEARFSQDFSQVRVHDDSKAAESADAVHAHAYTVGKEIVFGAGKYSQSNSSRPLLAHELTHVVQQTQGAVGAGSEDVASAVADRVSRGERVNGAAVGGAPVSLQRQEKGEVSGKTELTSTTGNATEPAVDGFDFDKTEIPVQHLDRLAKLRMKLVNAPDAKVVLTGHTDTVGTEKYNEDLGRRRAEAVRDFLSKGSGVNPSQIEIKSAGELQPAAGQPPAKLDPSAGEKNPKNRRVEIQVEGLPPTDTKANPPSDKPLLIPGITEPTPLVPQRPSIKELCIYTPDLCKPPDPRKPPPDLWKTPPPAPQRQQKSPLDLINENLVDPVVKAVTKGLPKSVQDKILELAHDGVKKGITSAASAAAAQAGLDTKGQQAIEKAVEAGIQYKGQQPGQEGSQ